MMPLMARAAVVALALVLVQALACCDAFGFAGIHKKKHARSVKCTDWIKFNCMY